MPAGSGRVRFAVARMPVAANITAIAFAVLAIAVSSYAQQPSADDVRADFAKGDYRSALTKLDKALFPTSPGAATPHRYELLMLKGECEIQLQDRLGAVSAFKSAAKEAADTKELVAAQA